MDKEILDMIKAKLETIKITIESAIDALDVDAIDSPSTGKVIALDFDDTDLTDIQIHTDAAAALLQDLSAEIDGYLV